MANGASTGGKAKMQGIEFEIVANSKDAVKSLDSLADTLKKLQGIASSGFSLTGISDELKSFSKRLGTISTFTGTKAKSTIKGLGTISNAFLKLNAAAKKGVADLSPVSDSIENFGNSLSRIDSFGTDEFKEMIDGLKGFSSAYVKLGKLSAGDTFDFTNIEQSLTSLADAVNDSGIDDVPNLDKQVESLNKLPPVFRRYAKLTENVPDFTGLKASIEQLAGIADTLKAFGGEDVSDSIRNLFYFIDALKELKSVTGRNINLNNLDKQLKTISDANKKMEIENAVPGMEEASETLSEVSNLFKETSETMTKATESSNEFSLAAENLSNKSVKTADKMELLNNTFEEAFNTEAKTKVELLTEKIELLRGKLAAAIASGEDLKAINIAQQIQRLNAELEKAKFEHFQKIIDGIKKAFSTAKAVISGVVNIVKKVANIFKSVISMIGKAITAFVNFGKTAGKAVTSVASHMGKLMSRTAKVAASFGKFAGSIAAVPFKYISSKVTDLAKRFRYLVRSFGRIMLYRAIRAAIKDVTSALKEGIQNLYYYSKEIDTKFHNSMNRVASDALYIKNAMASMVAPIINAVVPAVDALTDKLVAAFNSLAKLFAGLTGQKVYSKAIKKMVEYGEALDDVNKKQKDWTIGLDELNIIGDDKDDLSQYLDMFEEVEVPTNISDFADTVRDAIDRGAWEEVGMLLRTKLGEVFDGIPWKEFGAKLGEGVNIALRTIYSFLDGDIFEGLGRDIGEWFTSAMNQVSFETGGRIFIRKLTAVFDLMYGFIDSLAEKSGMVGRKIGEFVNGMILEAQEWIEPEKWLKFGENIGELLDSIIQNIYAVLEGHDFGELGESIAQMVNGIFDKVDLHTAGQLLVKSVAVVFDEFVSFIMALKWGEIGDKVGAFIQGGFEKAHEWITEQPWYEMGYKITGFISNLVARIKTTLDENRGAIGASLAAFAMGIVNGVKWDEVGALLVNAITWVVDQFLAFIKGLNPIDVAKSFAAFINGAFGQLKEWLDKKPFDDLGDKISTFINVMFHEIDWESIKDTLRTLFMDVLDQLKIAASNISWGEVAQYLVGGITWVIDLFIDFINSLDPVSVGMAVADFINGGFDKIREWLDSDKFTELAQNLKTMILTAIENINWEENLGTFFDVVVGIINWIIDVAKSIPPEKREEIGRAIGKAIGDIDWPGALSVIGTAVWNTLKGLIEGLFDSKNGKVILAIGVGILAIKALFKVAEIAGKIKKFVEAITGASGLGSIAGKLATIVSKIGEKLAPLASVIFSPKGLIILAVIAFVAAIILNWDKIKEAAGKLWDKLKEIWGNIKEGLSNIWDGIKETAGKFKDKLSETWDNIKEAVSNLKEKLSETWDNIKEGLSERWDNLKQGAEGLKTIFKESWDNIKEKCSDLKDKLEETWDGIKEGLSYQWDLLKYGADSLKNTLREDWEDIKENAGKLKEKLYESWDKICEKASDLKTKVGNAFKSLGEKIKGVWNDLTDGKSAMDKVSESVSGMADTVNDKISSMENTLVGKESSITSSLKNISQSASDAISGAALALSSIGSSISSAASKLTKKSTKTTTTKKTSIKGYASGGYPVKGDLFLARERGINEYVGSMNGKNAVGSNNDIKAGISSGVREANLELVGVLYSVARDIVDAIDSKETNINIGDDVIGRSNDRYNRSRGTRVSRGAFANAY